MPYLHADCNIATPQHNASTPCFETYSDYHEHESEKEKMASAGYKKHSLHAQHDSRSPFPGSLRSEFHPQLGVKTSEAGLKLLKTNDWPGLEVDWYLEIGYAFREQKSRIVLYFFDR